MSKLFTVITSALAAIYLVIYPMTGFAYDTQEEIKKSAARLDDLFEEARSISDEPQKMRVLLDTAGGTRRLLHKTYTSVKSITPEIENNFQLSYSFALMQIAGLAEQMGFPDIAACHMREAETLFKWSATNTDDHSISPDCRKGFYTAKVRSDAQLLIMDKDADLKYNRLAGGLIKQISLNSYYTVKALKTAYQ